jgi:hypothetical protein
VQALDFANCEIPVSEGPYEFNVAVPPVANSVRVPLTFNLGAVAGTQTLFITVRQYQLARRGSRMK